MSEAMTCQLVPDLTIENLSDDVRRVVVLIRFGAGLRVDRVPIALAPGWSMGRHAVMGSAIRDSEMCDHRKRDWNAVTLTESQERGERGASATGPTKGLLQRRAPIISPCTRPTEFEINCQVEDASLIRPRVCSQVLSAL